MKRLWSTSEWARRTRRLQSRKRREVKRRHRRGEADEGAVQVRAITTRNRANRALAGFSPILAPSVFSFVTNTEEMIKFLDEIKRTARNGRNIHIELGGLKSLSYDAILVLLSRIKEDRFIFGVTVKGNEPSDPALKQLFSDSGFYDYVPRTAAATPPRGKGSIRNRTASLVEASKTAGLVEFASEKLTGSAVTWKGVQRVFLECMSNTKDHASGDEHAEPWWACALVNEPEGKVQFSFLDNGVGIFQSVRLRRFQQVLRTVGLRDHPSILKELLSGEIGSRTGLSYRGKGLPAIRDTEVLRHEIENLVIITNDVYARPGKEVYRGMNRRFEGTFFYWEKGVQDGGPKPENQHGVQSNSGSAET
jgi:hypothetical protein